MSVSTKAEPRGPKGRLFLGSGPDFGRDQLGFYAACAREYGDLVPIRLGPRRAMLVYHPDGIEEILVTRNRDFVKSPGVRLLLRRLIGNGLFLAEGGSWLRQRRLVQPAFHRQRVAVYGEVMTACTARRLSVWHEGDVLDMHAEMMTLTQVIVAKTLFDADVADESYAIAQTSNVLAEEFGTRLRSVVQFIPDWVPTPGNLRAHRALHHLNQV